MFHLALSEQEFVEAFSFCSISRAMEWGRLLLGAATRRVPSSTMRDMACSSGAKYIAPQTKGTETLQKLLRSNACSAIL